MLLCQEGLRQGHRGLCKVIKTYPRSDKVAGAKLKIGLSYLNEKKPAKAKEYLHKVIKEHRTSDEAELAREKLKKIR